MTGPIHGGSKIRNGEKKSKQWAMANDLMTSLPSEALAKEGD